MAEEEFVSSNEVSGSFAELRQLYGFDTDRKWATAVQFFKEEEAGHVLLVFRENIRAKPVAEDGTEGEEQNLLGKNVTSIVMPVKVARSLGLILHKHLVEDSGK